MPEIAAKIKPLEQLAEITVQARSQGLRVVHCHGVFDLIHPGHVRHFEAARRLGDLLVVTLTADEYVNKGPGRPVFNQRLRAETIAALQAVNYVAVDEHSNAVEAIRRLRPTFYVKGGDDTRNGEDLAGDFAQEAAAVTETGGRLHLTDEVSFSSTRLLNDYFPIFSPEADEFLRRFRRRWNADQVIASLRDLRSLRVLVVGDIIIDEYHFCKAVGKSSKSATLTARFLSAERHAGGVLAVANHVAGFAGEVHLLTYLGDPTTDEAFIRERLHPNVRVNLMRQTGRHTVVKRRYVDPFQITKMFEVMWLDGPEPPLEAEDGFLTQLGPLATQCDLIIVADFGHGSVGSRTLECLGATRTFLAVNAQTNSANHGYNLITKYPRADYMCIDEEEMRLANHSPNGDIEALAARTAADLRCQALTVTRGSRGSLTWTLQAGFVQTPVFSTSVVDSVGAGDAYLSLTSLCARAGYDPELLGFVGNCVGALAVRIIGNREPIQPTPLYQFITTLLK